MIPREIRNPVRRLPGAPWAAWLLVALWLALVLALLLTPGDEKLVDRTHRLAGGTDLTDSLGHVALFGVFVILLALAWAQHAAPGRAIRRAVGVALALGLVIEVGQIWVPERGFALVDLAANWTGPVLLWLAGRRWAARRASTEA